VKGNDVPAYTERFQELTLICTKFVSNETEKVNKYISGLPDNIYGNVKSARPKTLDETIELANDLMNQKVRTYAERQSDNKRKADDSSRNNHGVLASQMLLILRRAMGQLPKGMVVLSVEHQGILREIVLSTDKSKNHKITVKNEQARAQESEEYKAEARKAKPQPKP
ncbi:hypothetical protein Tco_0094946, partial [Tanacetum coccineum]